MCIYLFSVNRVTSFKTIHFTFFLQALKKLYFRKNFIDLKCLKKLVNLININYLKTKPIT